MDADGLICHAKKLLHNRPPHIFFSEEIIQSGIFIFSGRSHDFSSKYFLGAPSLLLAEYALRLMMRHIMKKKKRDRWVWKCVIKWREPTYLNVYDPLYEWRERKGRVYSAEWMCSKWNWGKVNNNGWHNAPKISGFMSAFWKRKRSSVFFRKNC